jgi:uncharacterized protein Ymh
MNNRSKNDLAGIQYAGIAGASQDCLDAVMRFLQFGDHIERVRILSSSGTHALLLTVNTGDLIAIKSGFSSGYGGEGPRSFSYVLQLLFLHGVEIEEYEIDPTFIERLDDSALSSSDIEKLDAARPIRPSRWSDYVSQKDFERQHNGTLWEEFRPVIPFAIIDSRIIDLAISFWEGPDDSLLKGYRRLEDTVRNRTGIDEHSAKLFSQAFLGPKPRLRWSKITDDGERAGRANLFTGAYQAHRNPRAHRELKTNLGDQLAEFLLLNHLYVLENESTTVDNELKED